LQKPGKLSKVPAILGPQLGNAGLAAWPRWLAFHRVSPFFQVLLNLLAEPNGPHSLTHGEPNEAVLRVFREARELEGAVFRDRLFGLVGQFGAGLLPVISDALVLNVVRLVSVGEVARRRQNRVKRGQDQAGQVVEVFASSFGWDHENGHVQQRRQREEVTVFGLEVVQRRPEDLVERDAVPLSVRRVVEFQAERRTERHVPRLEGEPVQEIVMRLRLSGPFHK